MIPDDKNYFAPNQGNVALINRHLHLKNVPHSEGVGRSNVPNGSRCSEAHSYSSSSSDTINSDYISNEEDSSKNNENIIAPPSPFVTRSNHPKKDSTNDVINLKRTKDLCNINSVENDKIKSKPFHSTTIYINGGKAPPNNGFKCNQVNGTHTNKGIDRVCEATKEKIEISEIESSVDNPSVVHPPANAPVCKTCLSKDILFFNPNCQLCWDLLNKDCATPSHVFAILRLWTPQVQKSIKKLVQMALTMGCNINDRDYVTDMTLLHFAVKSGSNGIGNLHCSFQVVADLLKKGADLRQRCKWTYMTALHYAAYFDVPNVLELILSSSEGVPIDDPCLEYNNGSALHIAAANLSQNAALVLLRHGASLQCKDNQGKRPYDCIPTPDQFELLPELQEIAIRMCELFKNENKNSNENSTKNRVGTNGRAILKSIGIEIGNRVLVSGSKPAILRYAGPTEFATGLWAGVELESPTGRNNGTVKGVTYFLCARNYGLFVPINRITKILSMPLSTTTPPSGRERNRVKPQRCSYDVEDALIAISKATAATRIYKRSSSLPPRKVNYGRVDVTNISSKIAEDIKKSTLRKIEIGDKVDVDVGTDANLSGRVRYVGNVHFASGCWIGIELDDAKGFHDGSVSGTRYFSCQMNHGVMAISSKVKKQTSVRDSNTTNRQRERASSFNIRNNRQENHVKSFDSLTAISNSSISSFSNSSPSLLRYDNDYDSGFFFTSLDLKTKSSLVEACSSLSNINKCFAGRYISSRERQEEIERRREESAKEPQWIEPPLLLDYKEELKNRENPYWLKVGHSVFYKNTIGTIRYIGRVHFGEGTWLGIELRAQRGRHDGKVEGRRYFKCKKNHGILVPPKMVTVHGLNGELLVRQLDDDSIIVSAFSKLLIV